MSADHSFSERLLAWFDQYGRHDLPWQVTDDPYKVWVSEIMLQQTQVKTVLNYFDRFVARFPTIHALGNATWDEVAPYWAGLGYYARARNLHKAAMQVLAQGGEFPQTLEGWMALSGIGRSTAGALMSLGLRQYGVIMDGNVKRVLTRYFAIEGDSMKPAVINQLWDLATQLTPHTRNADYTQAIMDLGATVCTPKKPLCLYCPMQQSCQAFAQNRVLEFPQKTAKAATPTRQATVWVIEQKGQWLWLQRPNTGLWGGLWCLPITEDETSFAPAKPLGVIKHTFTHFTWLLSAQQINASQLSDQQRASLTQGQPTVWQSPQTSTILGIPQAMQKLIDQVCGS